MSRFLIVTWDGAGNLVPTLAIARRLSAAGHDVRLLGHPAIAARTGTHGWRFRPFQRTDPIDSAARVSPEPARLARDLWCGTAPARDVLDELAREAADVLVADCMLAGALTAGEAARVPTAALFHGAFTLFRQGPLAAMLAGALPGLNQLRADLALPAVSTFAELHDRSALSLVATVREFELPQTLPASVVHAGPLLDGPPLVPADAIPDPRPPDGPRVVVSFSTSQQGQADILARIIAALERLRVRAVVTTGPALDPAAFRSSPGVQVVRFAPHARLLRDASLVITHAGLGTVMAALARGVPMLAIPLGRDQFFNAARVEALGAGRCAAADADTTVLAHTVAAALEDTSLRAGAQCMAAAIASYQGGAAAVPALERLVLSAGRPVQGSKPGLAAGTRGPAEPAAPR